MQATTEFTYDASKDFEQPTGWKKVLFSLLILVTVLSYGAEMLDPAIKISGWRFALLMTIILSGFVVLLFPSLGFRPFIRKHSSYVTLQDGHLQWKLSGSEHSISIDDVTKVNRSPSQVQFVMKDGTIKILDFYKIATRQKVHEFLEVLYRQFDQKI